jgi:hypothetical protein
MTDTTDLSEAVIYLARLYAESPELIGCVLEDIAEADDAARSPVGPASYRTAAEAERDELLADLVDQIAPRPAVSVVAA